MASTPLLDAPSISMTSTLFPEVTSKQLEHWSHELRLRFCALPVVELQRINLEKIPYAITKLYKEYKKQKESEHLREIKLEERGTTKRLLQENKKLKLNLKIFIILLGCSSFPIK